MSTGKIIGIVLLVLGLTIGIFSGKHFFTVMSRFLEMNSSYGSGYYRPSLLFDIFPFVLGVVLFFTGSYIKNNAKSDDTSNKSLNYKKCPFCANDIKKEAIVCQYCNRDVPEFIATHRVKTMKDDEYLGLRDGQNIKNNSFVNISNGTEVQLLLSGNHITVDKLYAPWVKVKTKDNVCGWCFLGDLEKI